MSATAVVPAQRVRNELAAGCRHFVNGLRMTAHDPLALGVLAFAGALTLYLWGGPAGLVLGVDSLYARQYPWRGWVAAITESVPRVFRFSSLLGLAPILFSQLLGAAVVAGVLGRSSAPRRWPAAAAPAMPALPLGPRTRVIADVLVVTFYVLIARAAFLPVGGFGPGPTLFRRHLATYPEAARLATLLPSLGSPTAEYASWFVVNTILGTLFALPLVLAWATTTRLDGRGVARLAAAALVVFGAASVGAMARLATALVVSVSVSAFLLVRLDDGSRAEPILTPRPVGFRGSPGPLAQLPRDAWLGPVRRLWWALLLAGAVPLALTIVSWPTRPDAVPRVWRGKVQILAVLTAFLQWPTLLLLALFPLGLALVPRGTSASGLFTGAFLRSWSALPLGPDRVIRAVYAHGLLAAGFAWLMLCLQVRLRRAPLGPVLYELPVVFLMAGIAVCEAVGDRLRGLLAVGALAAFQFGVPLVFALLPTLGITEPFSQDGMLLGIAGYAVGLAGALPPLVHLRARSVRRGRAG